MQITINGQLLLSKLYEMILLGIPGAIPLMLNTDGLEIMIPNCYKTKYLQICEEWEKLTKLSLEHDEYKKMIIGDVNNYIAVPKDPEKKPKSKGRFEWEDLEKKKVSILHKNKSFLVIPKAIYHYFIHGTKPEDYLKSNRNIMDYCGGVKAKGGWKLSMVQVIKRPEMPDEFKLYDDKQKVKYLLANNWYKGYNDDWLKPTEDANRVAGRTLHDAFKACVMSEAVVSVEPLQKIVRYFVSTKGAKIVKQHVDGREIQVEAGKWMQQVFNKKEDLSWDEYNINEEYYIQRIYKEIYNIDKIVKKKYEQLSLF